MLDYFKPDAVKESKMKKLCLHFILVSLLCFFVQSCKQGSQNSEIKIQNETANIETQFQNEPPKVIYEGTEVPGDNFADKMAWLDAFVQSNNHYIFEIKSNENITHKNISFSERENITIIIIGIQDNATINLSEGSGVFTIGSTNTLILDNITISGGWINVRTGGSFIMNNNSIITRSSAGAVYVYGLFTMNSGTITRNSLRRTNWGTGAGGVYIGSGGEFIMNGGTISNNRIEFENPDNSSGGIRIESDGKFKMNNGSISNNTNYDTHYGARDPIGLIASGEVIINNGTISNNGVVTGGNTTIHNVTLSNSPINQTGGKIIMNGGTIRNNSQVALIVNGEFNFLGGRITNNASNPHPSSFRPGGAGVFIGMYGNLIMDGGTISNNSTTESGGGVYVRGGQYNSGRFEMNGGMISSNTAAKSGGGVFVENNATFIMNGGDIQGNIARENGGGVQVMGFFEKNGGTIYGYTQSQDESNIVKEVSGNIRNFRGHAIYAASNPNRIKIMEKTAESKDIMTYNATGFSGEWDN